MKKCENRRWRFGASCQAPPLQQLLLALPLGPQLTVLLAVLGLQAPEPYALPGVARTPYSLAGTSSTGRRRTSAFLEHPLIAGPGTSNPGSASAARLHPDAALLRLAPREAVRIVPWLSFLVRGPDLRRKFRSARLDPEGIMIVTDNLDNLSNFRGGRSRCTKLRRCSRNRHRHSRSLLQKIVSGRSPTTRTRWFGWGDCAPGGAPTAKGPR